MRHRTTKTTDVNVEDKATGRKQRSKMEMLLRHWLCTTRQRMKQKAVILTEGSVSEKDNLQVNAS